MLFSLLWKHTTITNRSLPSNGSRSPVRHDDLLKKIPVSAIKAITTKVALTVEAEKTIYVSPYERDGIEFFFLANASAEDASMTLHYEGAVGYRLYNPVNGEITEISADETCSLASYRALFVQPLMAE